MELGCLIKFGTERHCNSLLDHGQVYCQSVQYFRELEDEMLRGDEYEGAQHMSNHDVRTPEEREQNLPNLFRITKYLAICTGNIYCLYAVTRKMLFGAGHFISERVNGFGTHAVLIKDPPLFIDKFSKALEREKLDFQFGLVEYYDSFTYNGHLSNFLKPIEFEYQSEFRIFINRKASNPFIIELGRISDIAEIRETEDLLNTEFRLSPD